MELMNALRRANHMETRWCLAACSCCSVYIAFLRQRAVPEAASAARATSFRRSSVDGGGTGRDKSPKNRGRHGINANERGAFMRACFQCRKAPGVAHPACLLSTCCVRSMAAFPLRGALRELFECCSADATKNLETRKCVSFGNCV